MIYQDTIVALSTPPGQGALGIIRVSGVKAFHIIKLIFKYSDETLPISHKATLGKIFDQEAKLIDECVVTLFYNPRSFTGEHIAEISCHGSPYIIQRIINLILTYGARLALPGEFTQRAFLNGKIDLTQAEAIGDLIASQSASQHKLAMNQMRGGVSDRINKLRSRLIHFASLIELENDFGEEDVEFADRRELIQLIAEAQNKLVELIATFTYGKAIKEGIAVAIIGSPNVGKSTLLNSILKEEKAIVSDIPGTTRDVIEDTVLIESMLFRFIDTAGIHVTDDKIESIGIQKSKDQLKKANMVLWVTEIDENIEDIIQEFNQYHIRPDQQCIILLNKMDTLKVCHAYDIEEAISTKLNRLPTLALSAMNNSHVQKLKQLIFETIQKSPAASSSTIISNIRHKIALEKTNNLLNQAKTGLELGTPTDLIAIDIRHAQYHLGEIAGQISTEDLLDNIFSNFCIGK